MLRLSLTQMSLCKRVDGALLLFLKARLYFLFLIWLLANVRQDGMKQHWPLNGLSRGNHTLESAEVTGGFI